MTSTGGVTQRDRGTSRSVRRTRSRDSTRVDERNAGPARVLQDSGARPDRRPGPRREEHARPPRTAPGPPRRGGPPRSRAPGRRPTRRRTRPASRADRATQARIRVSRVHRAAGEHVQPGAERHRPGPVREQDLDAAGARPQQRDRRGGSRREGARGRAGRHSSSTYAHRSNPGHRVEVSLRARAGSRVARTAGARSRIAGDGGDRDPRATVGARPGDARLDERPSHPTALRLGRHARASGTRPRPPAPARRTGSRDPGRTSRSPGARRRPRPRRRGSGSERARPGRVADRARGTRVVRIAARGPRTRARPRRRPPPAPPAAPRGRRISWLTCRTSSASSASGSCTGWRHAKSRHTNAVGRPWSANRWWSRGTADVAGRRRRRPGPGTGGSRGAAVSSSRRVASSSASPMIAISVIPACASSRAHSHCANPVG